MIDKDLKQHVENALEWEPSVDAKDIGVSADQGVVTLRGTVPSCSDKLVAERVALRVYGVKAVANDLTVHVASAYRRGELVAEKRPQPLVHVHGGAAGSAIEERICLCPDPRCGPSSSV